MKILASLHALFAAAAIAVAAEKPNIIVILTDDLGYGDLGCYGHPSIRTPHLDRMAREGMRFTDFYSAAEVCTPSRAALLTGRYAIRSGMCHDQFRVLRNVSTGHLPLEEQTLPELLKPQGYATAFVGKWHLGVWANNPAGHPKNHGFDFAFGLPHSNDMDPLPGRPKGEDNKPYPDARWWSAPLYDGEKLIEQPADQTTLTRRYTEQAVRFIGEKKGAPFFLYFAHTFPHTPLFASEQFRGKSARGGYGDVVEEIDWSVGQVLEAVRAAGIEKDTFVFFTSDNGPWLIRGLAGGSAGLLREGKGSTWEGGMRVPGIAWQPGRVPAGSICHEPASTMDLFTTAAAWAGAALPTDRPIDGRDITPLLTASAPVKSDGFFFYRGARLFAARLGRWKAHFLTQPGYGAPKPEAHEPALLFDLSADPGESLNLAAEHPEVLRDITAAVERHRAALKPAPTQLVAVTASASNAPSEAARAAWWKGTPAEFQKRPAAAQEIDPQDFREELLSAAIFHETNARRAEQKLPALAPHEQVRASALGHAQAMAKGNYLSHGTPDQPQNSTPYDRLVQQGLRPRFSAENIAFNFVLRYESGKPFYTRHEGGRAIFSYEPEGVPLAPHSYASFAMAIVTQWMDSPGHRKNILAPESEFLGVGCALSRDGKGFDTIYAGQNFFAPLPAAPASAASAGE